MKKYINRYNISMALAIIGTILSAIGWVGLMRGSQSAASFITFGILIAMLAYVFGGLLTALRMASSIAKWGIFFDRFPFNLLKGFVPDALYVTSVVRIGKGEGLAYTVTPKYLTLNNLSGDDNSDFFHTLDVVLKIGSAEELNAKIGTTAANALIGMEQNPGFVYALKATGGSGSFAFVSFENEGKQINALVF